MNQMGLPGRSKPIPIQKSAYWKVHQSKHAQIKNCNNLKVYQSKHSAIQTYINPKHAMILKRVLIQTRANPNVRWSKCAPIQPCYSQMWTRHFKKSAFCSTARVYGKPLTLNSKEAPGHQESRREGWTDARSAVGFCLGSGLFGSYNSD